METPDDHKFLKSLDKNFFEGILNARKQGGPIFVLNLEFKFATAAGDNFMSDMFRAKLKISRDNVEDDVSLIVKCSPNKEHVKKMVSELCIFDREIYAFTVILPEFYRVLQEASHGTYQPFGASCLHHQDIESTTVIVLEDLKTQGFIMVERLSGLDSEHSLLVVRHLARFHAASIALFQKNKAVMTPFKLWPVTANKNQQEQGGDFFAGSLRSLANEVEKWHDVNEDFSHRLRILAESCRDALFKVTETNDAEFNVLTHGDLWVNNIMFRYELNQPKDLRFVDYQMSQWISPAMDLHYFLYTSLQKELWDSMEYFVEEYHKELRNTLQTIGLENHLITLHQLHEHLERRSMYALYVAVVVLPFFLRDPGKAMDVDDILKQNVEEGIASQNMHSSPIYRAAITKFLPTFAEKGLF